MRIVFVDFLVLVVLIGIVPVIVLLLQVSLVGLHGFVNHYQKCLDYLPHVAIIVPAWNEGDVIGDSIEHLMNMDYPLDALRLYVVDDASTDQTPEIILAKKRKYPDNIVYLRREVGGLGKAQVLNHGLGSILNDPWAEAILIVDADVLFESDALRKMTRHLVDPKVGAVTGYIREGQIPGNLITHFVAFEYILAQAASRRTQNVMGALGCLAGGAQLHTRCNIEALGGKIDSSTLAEDTFTTIKTQLSGKITLFDGNAIAISEEPGRVVSLWKQRYRWARGNIQITHIFRHLWFRGGRKSHLGGFFFGLVWFSTLLMPFTMIAASISLLILFFMEQPLSWALFRTLSIVSVISYIFTTGIACIIDHKTAKRAWLSGLLFPGIISIIAMTIAVVPDYFEQLLRNATTPDNFIFWRNSVVLAMGSWIGLSMLFAWGIYHLDRINTPEFITKFCLIMVGYGPLLCAIIVAAFKAELTNKVMRWDKTEKVGKTEMRMQEAHPDFDFEKELINDIHTDYKIFWGEVLLIIGIILLIVLRYNLLR